MNRSFALVALALFACAGGASSGETVENDASNDGAIDDARIDVAIDGALDGGTICPPASDCVLEVPIPPLSDPDGFVLCPRGSDATASPPSCIVEVSLGTATWNFAEDGTVSLTIDVLGQDLPIDYIDGNVEKDEVLSSDGVDCPMTVASEIPVPARLGFTVQMTSTSRTARPGCDDLGLTSLALDPASIPLHVCPYPQPADTLVYSLVAEHLAPVLVAAVQG